MRPSPKAAKRCRLSEGYGRGYDWPRTRDVLIDPSRLDRTPPWPWPERREENISLSHSYFDHTAIVVLMVVPAF